MVGVWWCRRVCEVVGGTVVVVLGSVGMGVVEIVGIEFEVITNILFFLITH